MTLEEFFHQYPEVAVAFSGGVDSAWLLHQAVRYARRCTAYFVNTAFQPAFEWEDADQTARQVGAALRVLELDILSAPEVTANPADRCYHCKKRLFAALARAAAEDGYHVLLDGTNASDDAADRPGMRALQELQVLSPLRLCGITKAQVRRSAKAAGLSVWDKPSYAASPPASPPGSHPGGGPPAGGAGGGGPDGHGLCGLPPAAAGGGPPPGDGVPAAPGEGPLGGDRAAPGRGFPPAETGRHAPAQPGGLRWLYHGRERAGAAAAPGAGGERRRGGGHGPSAHRPL